MRRRAIGDGKMTSKLRPHDVSTLTLYSFQGNLLNIKMVIIFFLGLTCFYLVLERLSGRE